jgi:outer membrane receptor protein involved in Fe transport
MARTAAACFLIAAAAVPLFAQGTTTATIRGRLTGTDGSPVAGTVTVTNTQTGVARRSAAGEDGRYALFGLQVGGPYAVRAQAIGYRAQERTGYRLGISDVVAVDFTLESTPVQVSEILVTTDATPVVDAQQPGLVSRVSEDQIATLPTNGRNFADFIALAPQVTTLAGQMGTGSGGTLSLGGGRTGANSILIDGVGNTGTFFGGEARGSDRIAFAYSIEAVREFQVETNVFDVSRGNFTGGVVNAVTRGGTNQFRGTVFGYRRADSWTKSDFLGRPPTEFTSNQYGLTLSGPIIRDKLHFYFVFDRQDRTQPTFAVDASSKAIAEASTVHPDSLVRLMSILQNVYGYDTTGEQGRIITTTDQSSIFARLDWTISNSHQLQLRYNYTNLLAENDRIATLDLRGAGGPFKDVGKSFVASLFSQFGRSVANEFRMQRALEPRPRPSNSAWPRIDVTINSVFRDTINGRDTTILTSRTITAGADDVLHYNVLEENTWQLQDNLTYYRGSHTFKVGTDNNFYHVYNFFGRFGLGQYTYRSLSDLENNAPDVFTRLVPTDTNTAIPFADRLPKALYDVREYSLYAQDQWQATPRLNLMFGLRYDVVRYPNRPAPNLLLQRSFPDLDVSRVPEDNNNVAPRFGFTYNMSGNSRTIVRGGAGLFYGRPAYVLFSNVFLNSGVGQATLTCLSSAGNVPLLDSSMANNHELIPERCVGGGAAAAAASTINVFAHDFKNARSFKMNFGVDHEVDPNLRIGFDFAYSFTENNYYSIDRNLNTTPQFFIEGGRPVFAPPISIGSTGSVNRAFIRADAAFGPVLTIMSDGQARNLAFVVNASQRFSRRTSFQASYTYSNTVDDASISCCTNTGIFAPYTDGNPANLRNARSVADYDRPHTIILSGIVQLPWDIHLSGIYRGYTGLPFTPVFGGAGDANGDGTTFNDRAFVGTNLLYNVDLNSDIDTLTQRLTQQHTLEGIINKWSCLRAAMGTIIRRNTCRQPWINQFDMKLSKRFNTMRGQSVEFVADFFNVLNFFNSEWGRFETVALSDQNLLLIRGFNTTQNRFVVEPNPTFGRVTPISFRLDQFSAQFGLRYNF